ncbi:30S ribosomal protein S6 [Candidatus Gracilibacteria bacterium]|nr:30S ribosomal protein S6 [Candidatus Gracilibacteria bacterium]
MRERRRDYELMYIISPLQANEEGVNAVNERVRQTIENNGGAMSEVVHTAPWGRRKLAYPIRAYAGGEASRRSFSEGYYVLVHFSINAAKLVELERTLKFTDAVLRHLVTVVEKKNAGIIPQLSDEDVVDVDDEDEELVEEGDD